MRRSGASRPLRVLALVAFTTVLALGVASVITVRSSGFRVGAARAISRALSPGPNAKGEPAYTVHLGGVDLTGWPRVRVTRLEVAAHDGTEIASAEAVVLRFSPVAFLTHRDDPIGCLREIDVSRPRVSLARRADGSWNLSDLFAGTGAGESPFAKVNALVRIRGGRVALTGIGEGFGKKPELGVSGIFGVTRGVIGARVPGLKLDLSAIAGHGAAGSAVGSINTASGAVAARTSYEGVNPTRIAAIWNATLPSAVVSLRSVAGSVSASGKLSQVMIVATAQTTGSPSARAKASFTVGDRGLDIGSATASAVTPELTVDVAGLRTAATGRRQPTLVRAAIRSTDVRRAAASFGLKLPIPGPGKAAARVELASSGWQCSSGAFSVGRVSGTFEGSLWGKGSGSLRFSASGYQLADLDQLGLSSAATGLLGVTGTVERAAADDGPARMRLVGTFRLDQPGIAGLAWDEANGTFRVSGGRIQLTDVVARRGSASYSGAADISNLARAKSGVPTLTGQVAVKGELLTDLAALLGPRAATTLGWFGGGGRVNAQARAAGPLAALRVDGHASVDTDGGWRSPVGVDVAMLISGGRAKVESVTPTMGG